MGLTLQGDTGMYLLEDDLIFELQPDHICVTNLFNYTMPLIRYRLNDLLVPDLDRCSFPFTKVKEVVGRYDEVLWFTNRHHEEDFIHPNVIVGFSVRGLNAIQIVWLDKTSFLFRARLDPSLSEDEERRTEAEIYRKLKAILDEKDMDNVTFQVQQVDSLPIDQHTGKFRLVVRADSTATVANERVLTQMAASTKLPVL
jgi:phenylacetate-coenzyme A ligase PaaK-like adenylate-forming protein